MDSSIRGCIDLAALLVFGMHGYATWVGYTGAGGKFWLFRSVYGPGLHEAGVFASWIVDMVSSTEFAIEQIRMTCI